MSVHISSHARSFETFLIFIKENRFAPIKESKLDFKVLNKLNLTGNETRPFTDKEIMKALNDYRYFENFFRQKGLWPDAHEYLNK